MSVQARQSQAIVMVITGGIAAYKALEVIRLLRKDGVKVIPVMTSHAKDFVTPLSVAVLAEHKVYTDFSDLEEGYGMGHIELSRGVDLVVVCPASANMLASHAGGFAGSLATSLLLASNKPIWMFPSMNPTMWSHAAVVAHVATLRERGVKIVDPAWGLAACNEEGIGRLPEPSTIHQIIQKALTVQEDIAESSHKLAGKHILITAGPTRESLDPVRYVTNRSTGLQGYALAHAAHQMGARVTLVSGPTEMDEPSSHIYCVQVESAIGMLEACEKALPADVFIGCAAVCDWYVENIPAQKIPKDEMAWKFVSTPDVIAHVAKGRRRPQLVVGFSAETGDNEVMVERACRKMKKKGCDWMVLNEVKNAMGAMDNEVTLLTVDEKQEKRENWPRMNKHKLARDLMAKIAETLDSADSNLIT